jgi:hypothetical protein
MDRRNRCLETGPDLVKIDSITFRTDIRVERTVMFWLFLAVIIWGLVHSLLATLKAKELILHWVGLKWMRFYRLLYNLFAGLSFLPVLAIIAIIPDRKLYSVPFPWSIPMIFGELLSLFVMAAGFRKTDISEFIGLRQLTDPIMPERPEFAGQTDNTQLVTTGVYHFVRHPLYSAGIAFLWLFPVMTFNLLAIDIALTLYIVAGTYWEENKLRRYFGREYEEYASVTPMFIPFLRRNKNSL